MDAPLPRTPDVLLDKLIDLLGELEEAITSSGYNLEPWDLGIQIPPEAHDEMADHLHEMQRRPGKRADDEKIRIYTPMKCGGWRVDRAR